MSERESERTSRGDAGKRETERELCEVVEVVWLNDLLCREHGLDQNCLIPSFARLYHCSVSNTSFTPGIKMESVSGHVIQIINNPVSDFCIKPLLF